ncbi:MULTISPECIES: DUF397 domain-containing protein [unclassified Streptomyces]|uniref:DUF397 domain-containing protein n=1 Tax=unclassified Streptomyces TaxID=2593676 RepID=UPI003369DEC3
MCTINWQKSSYSGQGEGDACVEVASIGDDIALRESDDPDSVVLTTPAELGSLLAGIKAGEFDCLSAPATPA